MRINGAACLLDRIRVCQNRHGLRYACTHLARRRNRIRQVDLFDTLALIDFKVQRLDLRVRIDREYLQMVRCSSETLANADFVSGAASFTGLPRRVALHSDERHGSGHSLHEGSVSLLYDQPDNIQPYSKSPCVTRHCERIPPIGRQRREQC